jgi:protein ImuA
MFLSPLAVPDPSGRDASRLSPAVRNPPDVNPDLGRTAAMLLALRDRIARIEHGYSRNGAAKSVTTGIPTIDQALPGGGLRLGALHETVSAGPGIEHAAAATLFIAGILARLDGPVLWSLQRPDLFAPGLAAAGLPPDRIIVAEAGKAVLSVMEEGLRHPALTAVVAELTGRVSHVASRRLELAAEQTGVLAILVRRGRGVDDPLLKQPTAAVTRWRIAVLPSPAALPHAPSTPGLGRARWRLELTRCRGGEPGSWVVEAGDATGCFDLVPSTSDRSNHTRERRLA